MIIENCKIILIHQCIVTVFSKSFQRLLHESVFVQFILRLVVSGSIHTGQEIREFNAFKPRKHDQYDPMTQQKNLYCIWSNFAFSVINIYIPITHWTMMFSK